MLQSSQAHELDQKIQDVYKRIETERKFLEASKLIRQATNNPDVLRKNDAKIREAERSLSYFEDTLRELHSRKMMQQREDHSRSSSASSNQPGYPQSPRMARAGEANRFSGSSSASDYANRGGRSPEIHPAGGPPIDDAYGVPKPKTYTNLDLIKADTPHTTAKISRMLHQLEYKLQVEMQYKRGIDKMAKLYQADGDKKSRADAESKRVESERKIQLLQSALKRYKTLHILDDVEEDDEGASGPAGPGVGGERKDNLRSKPLSGKLQITLKGARELDHAPIVSTFRSRSASKQVETYVSFRVEGTQRARSHPSKTDRWMEDFEITIDKANEVEIAVYDKQASEQHPTLIGLLWIKINDLVEAQRRQKVMMESGQGGWVTAGAMNGDASGFSGQSGSLGDINAPIPFNDARVPMPGSMPGMPGGAASEGIDAWFAVEPAGALALRLNFIKENVRKRPLDAPGGLGRQGAVRKRKDEVHEMNGHKFVQRQFYQIILCAFCNEFLLNAVGYQCEDCRYTCHKKCYEKVVTKCISKSNTGEDEEKINHRIPHRFEPINNIGANWCCHCGYMLPLGRKNARRCTECGITCHANCAHLVPDFCGMSMETANQLLRDMRAIKEQQRRPAQVRVSPQQQYPTQQLPPPEPSLPVDQMDRMRLGEVPPQQPQLPGYGGYRTQSPARDMGPGPQSIPPPGFPQQPPARAPAAGRPVVASPFPTEPQQVFPGRPGAGYEIPPAPDAYQAVAPQVPQKQPSLPASPAMAPRMTPTDRQTSLPPVPQPDVQQLQQQQQLQYRQQVPPQQQQQQQPPARKRKVGLDDFNFLAVLGKGNFGKVMLAEEKKTNQLYAIKVLKKEFIIDNDEVERHGTETRVYFVMEYVSGGDLMLHIQRKQFSLRQAKFYASEVLLALEYFHANGIIYRDLKLDNILLTLDGHVKVADYGLCKEDMWYGSTTSTFCGTPEFMAPEILLEQRYGRAVDWWAFGVLMYEMLLGQSPFRGDDEDEIFDAILEDEPLYPITMPRDAVSILQKLLTRDPSRRLGAGKSDAEEVKRHPFFKDVNFDDVLHKRIPPPYFPTINGSADISNFDEEFTKEQPTLTPVHTQLSARDQAEFNGFSWVASWADI
ncbi:hypothetical protein BN946_scf184848.g7 [Trametes cinnabarina]|uniref:protein kinase C n=1 Tax=Pycnoporus cinnabarinus TaxID=5643 RepID=A0A060SLT1_PYCCI|nr:hypothetical protein BN946_scf184848.g7 [Trametes cinnabarina]